MTDGALQVIPPSLYCYRRRADSIPVFSAPKYCDSTENKGAYINIGPDLELEYHKFDAVPHPDIKPMVSPLPPPQAYTVNNHDLTGVRAKLSHVVHDVVCHLSGLISRPRYITAEGSSVPGHLDYPSNPGPGHHRVGVISPVAMRRTFVTQTLEVVHLSVCQFTSM